MHILRQCIKGARFACTVALCSITKGNCSTMAQSTNKLVLTEKLDKVFIITINRPEKRNCVNPATALALEDAVKEFEENDDLWVAILTGQGGNFCAGFDLSELATMDQENNLLQKPPAVGQGPMGPSRRIIQKPLLAAIEGYAVAGGLELALMCDMRIVSESAILGVFCRRFGVPLIDGGTVRLPKLIGLSRALDLILTGRAVTGPEAFTMGLANRVSATGASLGEAVKIAQALCTFPQECLRHDRLSAYHSSFSAGSLQEAFDYEFNNGMQVVAKESVSGASKFVQGIGKKGSFNLNNSKL